MTTGESHATDAKTPLEAVLAHLDAHRPAERTLETRRKFVDDMLSMEPLAADVVVTPLDLGGVPAEKLAAAAPTAGDASALLYLHGGGYSLGSIAGYRPLGGRLARAFGGPLYLVGYRLAPEHPYPAGLDDTVNAFRALVASGLPATRIAVAGDSAGGGLAVALCLRLRDAGDAMPAALGLLSPWIDLEGNTESMRTKADLDPIVTREGMLSLVELYIGDGDRTDPFVAPIHADLRGLPPMVLHAGTRETQLDQAVAFAARARAAGVTVSEHVWEGMLHVFQMFPPFPEAQRSLAEIGGYLRRCVVDNQGTRSE